MGLLDRILGRKQQPVDDDPEGLVSLSGTTTTGRDAITALASRHGAAAGGYLELPGSEPTSVVAPLGE